MTRTDVWRRLDSWLGLPAAAALACLPRRRRALPQQVRHVAVVKFMGLGSLLACSGALRALRQAQPDLRLTFVTFDAQRDLPSLLGPLFDRLLTVRQDSLAHAAVDGWRAWRALRREKPDVIVDLEYFSKVSTVLCALSGARYRLGFLLPARWRRRLLHGGVAFREDLHVAECVARLLHPLGVDYRRVPVPEIVPNGAADAAAAALLQSLDAAAGRWVMVNPHANDLCVQRRWPVARFAETIDRLASWDAALRFLVPGTAAEAPLAAALREGVGADWRARVHVLAGRTTLPLLAGVLRRCSLMVTNDSGLMHLAAAAGTPLVALFGPENPVRYAPLGRHARQRVLTGDVPCGPCLSYMNFKRAPCDKAPAECMSSIEVEEVFHAGIELIEPKEQ